MLSHETLAYAYLATYVAFVLLRGAIALRDSGNNVVTENALRESRLSVGVRTGLIVIQTTLMACYGFHTLFGLFAWIDAFALALPEIARFAALALSLFSLSGIVWVHAALGRMFSDRLELRQGHALRTDGPYRWVRHPMYFFLFAFFFASAVLSANILLMLCSAALMANIYVRIGREEAMLRAHFGAEFDAYASKTARLLPGLF
jgi:protein-S-isoprenylcysteine O-methyltransferase Ste14